MPINPCYLYQDDDIRLVVKAGLAQLGKFAVGCSYRLVSLGAKDNFPEAGHLKRYIVLLTDAVDTVGLSRPIDFYLNKSVQPAPASGAPDYRRDVFDELTDVLTFAHQETNIKIIFPYNITEQHWLTAEIQIHRSQNCYLVRCCAHDPFGGGEFIRAQQILLEKAIRHQILTITPTAQIDLQFVASCYRQRQAYDDSSSCGVITCEDILLRINGKTLDRGIYPPNTIELRAQQLRYVEQALDITPLTKQQFRQRIRMAKKSIEPLAPKKISTTTLPATTIEFFESHGQYLTNAFHKDFKATAGAHRNLVLLPYKTNLSEEKNRFYDARRIEYVIRACDIMISHYSMGRSAWKGNCIAPSHQQLAEGMDIINQRMLIANICTAIMNLSRTIHGKYEKLLAPQPFTWNNFEQLGGLMRSASEDYVYFEYTPTLPEAVAERFFEEHRNLTLLMEAALADIINTDIPLVKLLFLFVQKNEQVAIPDKNWLRISFFAIKALTRRTHDITNLIKLLKYTDNELSETAHADLTQAYKTLNLEGKSLIMPDRPLRRKILLDSKLMQHAALRRLTLIGELVTGKHISSFITRLEPSIDWQAFITIRDTILHQDEDANYFKVKRLLADTKSLAKILKIDLQHIHAQLMNCILLRDASLPNYNPNIELFWQEIYRAEKRFVDKPPVTRPENLARTSPENLAFFKTLGMDQPIEAQWLGILSGQLAVPNKKVLGDLMRHLPGRKDNKTLHDKCKEIIDAALNCKTTEAERIAKRNQLEMQSQQTKLNATLQFKGAHELRSLANQWQQQLSPQLRLNTLQHILLAIAALENIKEFFQQDEALSSTFSFSTLEAFNNHPGAKRLVKRFLTKITEEPDFAYALEYNATQLIQHLRKIADLPEAKNNEFLDKSKNYPLLHSLRNWIAHGDYLKDRPQFMQENSHQDRNQIVGPVMITLVYTLLPDLITLKSQYAHLGNPDYSTYQQNSPWGPGYGF